MVEKIIKQTVYIASDGEEFKDKEKCLEYESFLLKSDEYKAARERLKSLKIEYPSRKAPDFISLELFIAADCNLTRIKGKVNRYDYDFKYYKLNSKEDALVLATVIEEEYQARISREDVLKKSGKMSFPCVAALSEKYGYIINTFDREKRFIEKYCNFHGYNVSFEKIEKEG